MVSSIFEPRRSRTGSPSRSAPVRISGPLVSNNTAQMRPVLAHAERRFSSVSRWYSCVPCEKLKRATDMPACSRFSRSSTDRDEGPSVQMMWVFLGARRHIGGSITDWRSEVSTVGVLMSMVNSGEFGPGKAAGSHRSRSLPLLSTRAAVAARRETAWGNPEDSGARRLLRAKSGRRRVAFARAACAEGGASAPPRAAKACASIPRGRERSRDRTRPRCRARAGLKRQPHGLSPSDAESSRTSYFAGFGAIIHGFPRLDALFSRTPKRDLARRELFPRFGELAKRVRR